MDGSHVHTIRSLEEEIDGLEYTICELKQELNSRISIRDQFAMACLSSSAVTHGRLTPAQVAKRAYAIADSMLAARVPDDEG